jgi:transcription-repair coupling factor (superfamily II helicase)
MEKDTDPLDISEGITAITQKLNSRQQITVKTPTTTVSQSYVLAKLLGDDRYPKSPVLLVALDEFSKQNLLNHITLWLKNKKSSIPIYTKLIPSTLIALQDNISCLIILTEDELRIALPSPETLQSQSTPLKANQKLQPGNLVKKLASTGYNIERSATEAGTIARRGSIVDIIPGNAERGIRIDFDDERIETIKTFTPGEPKTKTIEKAAIPPHTLGNVLGHAQISDYNAHIKKLILSPFPPKPDAVLAFSRADHVLLTQELEPEKKSQKKPKAIFIKGLLEGDHVVHVDHGIARFLGIVEQKIESITREYFKLGYAEEDTLFLPVTMAEKMEKYIGDPHPTLNRLSSSSWGKSLAKVSVDTLHEARELLNLQAKRELAQSPIIPRDKKAEADLKKSFPYTETSDQSQVIEDLYDDLAKPTPMDRLVCGDVGFGKTEIAIRAAAKAALAGFQVAMLSPTTILTQQHIDTFLDRLKRTPLKLSGLSRFQSKQEQANIVEQLKQGSIDIIIGTHRLLSEDVNFRNLGLIIIDEEQRFGVAHKEQLKKLRAQAHVLTLTATPIPRTLHLALSGVRTVSTIMTPPAGRKPIETIIETFNQKHVTLAIEKELKRKGQVYYLYNKVESMVLKQKELASLMPKVTFGILHGQLPEQDIAQVMHEFDRGRIDVLICSTIIENGLDLPNVNTLIVDNAVQFGLAQLHQIRGRIGRGTRQAYAYFFFKRQKLTGEAEKRLAALEEARELGAGFDLAQRDMEIRGVGNVLGKSQHGHVKSIGLGLYLRLLGKAVDEIKSGESVEVVADISIDLPLEARIPQFFEGNAEKRIELYHQWALIDNLDELRSVKEKLQKQGALPKPIEHLFYILKIKILGRQAGITAIDTSFASINSNEQIILIQTKEPIAPKRFSKMLETCEHWHYGTDEISIAKKDLGNNWMKELEKCITELTNTN